MAESWRVSVVARGAHLQILDVEGSANHGVDSDAQHGTAKNTYRVHAGKYDWFIKSSSNVDESALDREVNPRNG